MSLAVICPHCQHGVSLPEEQAGQFVACPECRKEFEAPPLAQAVPEVEPLKRVSTTGIPMSAWQALTDDSPPDDDPPLRGRGSFPPPLPPRGDWELVTPAPAMGHEPLEPGWGRVSSALRFIGIVALGTLGVCYLFSCFGLLETEGMDPVLGCAALIGMALYLFALYEMCGIPAQSGVSGLAQAAAWTSLGGFICAGLGLFLVLLSTMTMRNRPETAMYIALSTLLFLGTAMLILAGAVLFVFVLRGIATFFGDARLAQGILVFFFCLLILPVAAFMVLVCLLGEVGYRHNARVVAIVVSLVVTTILSLWFFSLLRDVRARIDSARRQGAAAVLEI